MKTLFEYISEDVTPTTEYQIGTTDEFINWGVWIPNDDLSAGEYEMIAHAFYNKYPVDNNNCGPVNCGTVAGISVKCDYKYKGNNHWVEFTFFWGGAPMKDRMKVIEEIANFLSNTIYSVVGGKQEMRNLLNKMTD